MPKHAQIPEQDEGVLYSEAEDAADVVLSEASEASEAEGSPAATPASSGPKHAAHAAPAAPAASSHRFAVVMLGLLAALLVAGIAYGVVSSMGLGGEGTEQTEQADQAEPADSADGAGGTDSADGADGTEQTEPAAPAEPGTATGLLSRETLLSYLPEPEPEPYTVKPTDLDKISTKKELGTFALYSEDSKVPELTADQKKAIQAAINSVRSGRNAGFVFVDLTTGKGISYNASKDIFGASSFKGPYSLYICQTAIDGGKITTDSSTGELINAAVTYSDNGAYQSLRSRYNGSEFNKWLESMNIETGHFNRWIFPEYSAQESAKMWEQAYLYQQEGNETSKWLFKKYAKTNVSFIRTALKDEKVQVWNKAGWIANTRGASSRSNGVSDAGIIAETDGHTYVMSILTDTPDSGSAEAAVQKIASSLFDARDALNWSDEALATAKAALNQPAED